MSALGQSRTFGRSALLLKPRHITRIVGSAGALVSRWFRYYNGPLTVRFHLRDGARKIRPVGLLNL
jgi:hypothetical protein